MTDDEALARARAFAAEHVEPHAADWEHDRRLPREAITRAAEAGLADLIVPAALGGSGLGAAGLAAVLSEISRSDMGFAFSLVVHNNLAGSIAGRGSDAQKACYLPAMARGEILGAFLLTEPKGGSDAAAITTMARREGGGWVLEGEKTWVTNATHADLLNVYVQTEPGSGTKGIAAFLVRADQPGVERLPGYHMFGAHATGTGGVRFDGVRLGPDQVFLAPGEAFGAAMAAIDLARVLVAAMCTGMLRRAIEIVRSYLNGREAFGAPLSAQQGLRWSIADVATDTEAAAALASEAIRALDAGAPDRAAMAAHAKKFATRAAMSGLAACMQALGANGFRQDRPLARHLAAAKMAEYLDGTTEVQNIVIARALFGR